MLHLTTNVTSFHDLYTSLPFNANFQALRLIDKPINGPLWRMIVKEIEVLNMSTHYQYVYKFLKEGTEDATAFLSGAS